MPYPFKSSQNLRVSSVLEAPCCIRISPRVNGTIFLRHTTTGGGSAGVSSGWDKGQIHLSHHLEPLAHELTAWKHNDLSIPCSTPTPFRHGRVCTHCSLCHADLLFHSLHLANSYLSSQLVVLKVWSQPAVSASPRSLLETQILGTHLRPIESETLGVESRNLFFRQALQVILMCIKI